MCNETYQSTLQSDDAFAEAGFDSHAPLHIRSGETVNLITTNGPGEAPIIGIIETGDKHRAGRLHRWGVNGRSYGSATETPRSLDLVKNRVRTFSWEKAMRTRNNDAVTVICTNRAGERPFVALVHRKGCSDRVVVYYDNGLVRKDCQEHRDDLMNPA